ncbi:MAG: trypsin-like peptidase domain-containing protein [Cytophagaceae bacterium]|jgi:S1-C subfamily serine protease|nr:trypsin-like peptidase domain-containing protein [Cytophagaceae bacterium]
MSFRSYFTIVGVSILCSSITAFVLYNYVQPTNQAFFPETYRSKAPAYTTNYSTIPTLHTGTDFVAASAQATPSVVFISTTGTAQRNNWFDWYFNGSAEQVISSGSGVIFSADGYIITNHHVIQRATKIEVIHQRNTYEATIVGSDPSSDLAVLKIEGRSLPAVRIAASSSVQIGEWVLAVGNPFNLTSTVTAGIVSAKGRNINVVHSQFPIESFIQTDAAINPGNSGGALVNSKGELIGINTAILSRTGSYAGYGFAVPSDIVVKIVQDLIQYGMVQKAFFGAEVVELSTSKSKELKNNDVNGVYIVQLLQQGAASESGLELNDVITHLDSKVISTRADFDEYIALKKPGDKIRVLYKRQGVQKETQVLLYNQEGSTGIIKKEVYNSASLNADFEVVPKVEREKLGISSGVKVLQVRPGLIARMGLSEGFIITSINRVPTTKAEEVEDILSKIKGRVLLEGIQQNGGKMMYQFYF